jgi:diguanylate cyclase (GGDEF)-like protein
MGAGKGTFPPTFLNSPGCGFTAALGGFAVYFNFFEMFEKFAERHESWQLDEAAMVLIVVGFVGLIFSYRRIVDLRHAREAAEALARKDKLTGLANRRGFLEQLHEWKVRLGGKERCAVFLIDLDDFKPINDLYGHRVGDEVLRIVAQRLNTKLAGRASQARIGGDEFGVASEAEAAAEGLLEVIELPIRLAALLLGVKACIGISMCKSANEAADLLTVLDGDPVDTVIRKADMALYEAKKHRACFRFFAEDMDDALGKQVELERELPNAIKMGVLHEFDCEWVVAGYIFEEMRGANSAY